LDNSIDAATPERKAALAKYKYVLRLNYAATVDFYTGAVADGVIHYIASKDPSRLGAQRRDGLKLESIDPNRLSAVFFQAAFGKNYTGRIALKRALKSLEFGGSAAGADGKRPDLLEHINHLSIDELQSAFRRFDDFMLDRGGPTYVGPVNSRAEVDVLDANSSLRVDENVVLEELCERLTERRQRVIELIDNLN
jgi:hypothetical protein